jgi:hypothetical protein
MATLEGRFTEMTTPELLQALKEESQRLTHSELDGAKRELKQTGKKAAMGGGMLAAGGVIALLGCIWLVGAAVWALALALPLWASALIIGAGVALIGAAIAWAGAQRMKKLKPERTIKNLEEDQQWLKGTLHQALAMRRGPASA